MGLRLLFRRDMRLELFRKLAERDLDLDFDFFDFLDFRFIPFLPALNQNMLFFKYQEKNHNLNKNK
jgi:hypothetical protein